MTRPQVHYSCPHCSSDVSVDMPYAADMESDGEAAWRAHPPQACLEAQRAARDDRPMVCRLCGFTFPRHQTTDGVCSLCRTGVG